MTVPHKELFEFDAFRFDPAEHLLLRDGEPVPLEPKVFETLLVLIRHGGRLVGKEELMQAVWPDSFVEESNLTRNISVLRKALNPTGGGPQYIETVPKRGYRFVGEVRALAAERDDLVVQSARVSVVVEEEESDEETKGEGEISTEQEHGAATRWKQQQSLGTIKRHKVSVAVTLVLSMAAVAAAVYFNPSGGGGQAIDSLAVLPFVNVDGNPDTEYLTDGITDGLINSLSQLPRLKIMSRNSVFRYKGREMDAQAAGKQLGVRAVLTGRVAPHGDGVSISIELVDARDNRHLWGERYNYKLSEIPAVQAELSRDISENLRLKLSGEDKQRLTKRYTENAEAFDLYLKGRFYLNALTPEEDKKSLEYFQRAIDKDPRYGPAYAGLAEYYAGVAYAVTTSSIPPKEAYSKAKAAALRAVELDDTLAEAHTSLGIIAMLHEWDWNGTEREFKRAISLNPNYVNAHHWYSHYLMYTGRFAESLAESQRVLALDPLDVAMNFHLGFHYFNARQYDQAIAQLQKVLGMDRKYSEAHVILGLVYGQKGLYKEAVTELQQSMGLGGADHRGNIGRVYAASGKRDEAQKLLNQLQEESKHKYVSPYNGALIYEGLGQKDQAFAWLEKAYEERDSNIINLKVDPQFDSLHSDPRFTDLLRRVGLPQ
jgi:TolB-like protein/DNA-binding winged helix-turn-helix (wHTH) protein/Flp pilus assembly protein TadD